MRDFLRTIVVESGPMSTQDIFMRSLAAAVVSLAIFVSYWYTHLGTAYSKKFNVSLITLTILTNTVIMVIGNNIALSLGMVGALSIIRFRTAIKDSRDATYIFWAIVAGLACGVGDYPVAAAGSVVVFVVLLVLGRVRNDNRILIIVKGDRSIENEIEATVFSYFNMKALQRVKNTTAESVEFIFELTRSVYNITYHKQKNITQELYELEGIDYVNVVNQNDEISG